MRNVICDSCGKEVEGKYFELCFVLYGDTQSLEEDDESYQFCSETCMGKWMVEKAKEDYGVYG